MGRVTDSESWKVQLEMTWPSLQIDKWNFDCDTDEGSESRSLAVSFVLGTGIWQCFDYSETILTCTGTIC